MNKIRGLIIVASIIALFLALFFFVQFTGFLFDIQQKYADSPTWLIALYIGGVAVISFVGIVLIYRLSRIGSAPQKVIKSKPREVIDDTTFTEKMSELQNKGADTAEIEADWQNLLSIRENAAVSVAVFGEVNAGKSSLIQTLTGQAVDISARAGQTQYLTEYPFQYNDRPYTLIDMPGINEVTAAHEFNTEKLVKEKAIKSHIVLWVVEEELTQSSFEAYQYLQQFNKPMLIAINKADYYSDSERLQITERIQQQLKQAVTVVWTSAATTKVVEKHFPDGRIESHEVPVSGQISELIQAMESLTFDRLTLDYQLNDSYFQALEVAMDDSLQQARQEKAERIIKSYSQKAIFGGMAAVGPGTDVLLQGYLGMGMARELCALYDVDVKSVDLEDTLSQLNDKMKKELAVILALVGNVCKAFPGVGTVAGGAMHAIAYGLIFESLGKAMAACLAKYHGINREQLATELEGQISGNLEARATRLAKAVIFRE